MYSPLHRRILSTTSCCAIITTCARLHVQEHGNNFPMNQPRHAAGFAETQLSNELEYLDLTLLASCVSPTIFHNMSFFVLICALNTPTSRRPSAQSSRLE